MAASFDTQRYYALTLDPVHVGTGGYRLGRVDNTILREPGTNLPKIPGSSIAGVSRAFTAMAIQCAVGEAAPLVKTGEEYTLNYDLYKMMKYLRPKYKFEGDRIKTESGNPVIDGYESCAGKGGGEGDGHCGAHDCPVCISYGFSKKENSFQGLAQFTDARILFFPVHSMIGPVWITCPSVLNGTGIRTTAGEIISFNKDAFRPIDHAGRDKLNFGWLMLPKASDGQLDLELSGTNVFDGFNSEMVEKQYLVPDRLFSQLVNDNLEVRTSVAIDPRTGAAEEGALYTYEAIPRAAVLWFDVVYSNPAFFKVRGKDGMTIIKYDQNDGDGISWIKKSVEKGFPYIATLGLGGMNTRGMGRVRIAPPGVAS